MVVLYPSPESGEEEDRGERSTRRVDYLGQLDIARAEHKWCDGHFRRAKTLSVQPKRLKVGVDQRGKRAYIKGTTGQGTRVREKVAMRSYFYPRGIVRPGVPLLRAVMDGKVQDP